MTAYGRRGHFATLLSETPTKKHTPYSKFKDAARDGTRDITRRPRAVQRNVGFVVRIRPKCKHSAKAPPSLRRRLRRAATSSTVELDHLAEEAVDGVRINPRISLLSEIEEYF